MPYETKESQIQNEKPFLLKFGSIVPKDNPYIKFTAYPASNYTIEITLTSYANFQLCISG